MLVKDLKRMLSNAPDHLPVIIFDKEISPIQTDAAHSGCIELPEHIPGPERDAFALFAIGTMNLVLVEAPETVTV
jgi:hypothetical protein